MHELTQVQTSVLQQPNAFNKNSSHKGHCRVIDSKEIRVRRHWNRASEMIGANLTADQMKKGRNGIKIKAKEKDRNTKTAPLLQNLRVWSRQTWHRLLIVHAQVNSVPPGTSHACHFHLLEQTYYSRFFATVLYLSLSLSVSIYFHTVLEGKSSPNK
jgi:hypothetical protein